MAITRLNSLAIPAGTIVESDLSYPLTNFSSTGIDDNATSTAITIDSSENVGIGTTSPQQMLHLSGSVPEIRYTDTTGNEYRAGNNNGKFRIAGNNNGKFRIYDQTAASDRLVIDGSGNVGIGTASPGRLLDVEGIIRSNGTSSAFALGGNSSTPTEGAAIHRPANGTIAFVNESSESMRIDSSGRLMIGTTSPISTSAFLSVYQATGSVFGQTYGAAILNGEQSIWQAGARASGTGADRYCALSVYKHSGVTNAAPYLYLQEEDGNAAYYWTDNTGVLKYSNSAANVGTTGGGAVGAQTSDERLKNIEEGFEYGIETVKALTPIAYRRNDEESPERKLGFGAQTTQAIVPEVVFDTGDCLDGYDGEGIEATPKTDNTILGMEYVQLIPVLTKAIQEQQAMIEELKAEVAALKGA
jgi:hypothetical protein